MNPRLSRNNFDLLRTIFASVVCLVHSYELSGYESLAPLTQIMSSATAVKSFFVVSGFLIFMSYERSTSISSYAGKRFRRVYPAYFTVVTLCGVFLVAASSKSVGEYFSITWLKYVASNLAFLNFIQPTLPGVFEGNKFPFVNGPLWTLKIEVMFYILVPLFVFLVRKFRPLPVLLFFYLCSVAYAFIFARMAANSGSLMYLEIGRQLPGQLSYFMAGAFFFYFLDLFERRVGYFLAAAVLILSVNVFYPLPLFEPFAIAALVAFFGLFLYVGNFGKYGDFSYGIYIVHYPLIQLLLQAGVFRESPAAFLMCVISATFLSAFAMWHLVEKRFLLRSSHYISTSATTAAS